MDIDNDSVIPAEEKGSNIWSINASLSKILIATTFISLLFIGGWIGYSLVPPQVLEVEKERIVEIEKEIKIERTIVTRSADTPTLNFTQYQSGDYKLEVDCGLNCSFRLKTKDDQVLVDDIQEAYYSHTNQRRISLLSLKYISSTNQTLYFSAGLPDSGVCCDVVSYNIESAEFKEFNYVDQYLGIIFTDGGFMVVPDEDGKGITVYDLDNQGAVVDRVDLTEGSIIDSSCTMFSPRFNLTERYKTIIYGVHKIESSENTPCSKPLIEYRELKLS